MPKANEASGRTAGSRLLIDEPPLQVIPALACALGLNEALILQQLHYWTHFSENIHEGHRWVYNTLGQWQRQFPFWSEDTIKRTFRRLRDEGIVVVAKLALDSRDRTNWYRIDYTGLAAKAPDGEGNLPRSNIGAASPDSSVQAAPMLSHTEKTTETTDRRNGSDPSKHTEPMGFEEWLEHHCSVTEQQVPGRETKARAELARKFSELTGEGRSLDDMKLASIGAHADKWRAENGKDYPRNVLVFATIDELIDKGRRVGKSAAKHGSFERKGPGIGSAGKRF